MSERLGAVKAIAQNSPQLHVVFDEQLNILWQHPIVQAKPEELSSILGNEVYVLILGICKDLEIGQSELLHSVSKSYLLRKVDDFYWVEELPMTVTQVTSPLRRRLLLGQLLGDFVHSISNPMAVIQGRLELANLRAKDSTKKKLYTMLYGQVLRISTQLQSIQAISTQRNHRIKQIDMNDWLNHFFELPHRQEDWIDIEIPENLVIWVDETNFELALENILLRCRTVMTPNSRLKLFAKEHPSSIDITIEYYGSPPSKKDLQAIENSVKQQTLPQRFVGYQIICVLMLIQSFNASFKIHRTSNGGRFTFSLHNRPSPLDDVPDLQLGAALRILVIDDNLDLATALGDFLMHEGHFVQQVNSAEQAMLHIDQDWDCIILDLQLPKLSGEEFYSYIKQNHPKHCDNVICISGQPPREIELRRRFLSKPFTLSQLIAAIFQSN